MFIVGLSLIISLTALLVAMATFVQLLHDYLTTYLISCLTFSASWFSRLVFLGEGKETQISARLLGIVCKTAVYSVCEKKYFVTSLSTVWCSMQYKSKQPQYRLLVSVGLWPEFDGGIYWGAPGWFSSNVDLAQTGGYHWEVCCDRWGIPTSWWAHQPGGRKPVATLKATTRTQNSRVTPFFIKTDLYES